MSIESFIHLAGADSKKDTVDWINSQDERLLFGFRWPDDDAGGDIFDEGFRLYTTLSTIKTVVVFLCMLIVTGMLVDDFRSAAVSQEACQKSVIRQVRF